MAINKDVIKGPAQADTPDEKKQAPGTYNGLPGFQKRTAGAGGPPEKILEGIKPTEMDIKTPVTLNKK